MKQKDRYLIMIFLVIFIMNFVIGIIEKGLAYKWFSFHYQSSIILSLIIISPLVFVSFYLIGEKFDLKSNLKFSIINLLSGAVLGYFLSSIYWYIRSEIYRSMMMLLGVNFLLTIVLTFFIAFSALALAYLRTNDYSKKGEF